MVFTEYCLCYIVPTLQYLMPVLWDLVPTLRYLVPTLRYIIPTLQYLVLPCGTFATLWYLAVFSMTRAKEYGKFRILDISD